MAGPALVVAAAGASVRLGTAKALVEIGGRAALLRLLDGARGLGDPAPLVVTGAHHREIAALVAEGAPEVELLEHRAWAEGRTAGLAAGRRRRAGRDLCLAPVDCPLVGREVFEALAAAWEARGAPPRGWLAPRLEPPPGSRSPYGHPVIVGRSLAQGLEALGPDEPLRALRRAARPLWSVPVADPAVLDDLDGLDDLKKLRAREGDPTSDGG